MPNLSLRSSVAVIFAPTDRFFLRLVPLAADLPALDQVELSLEGLAPFPAAQLYWGCCVAPDRTQALVYAAHRRRFTAEETAAWAQADLVVPDVLPLLGAAPAAASMVVQTGDHRLGGAAWAGPTVWPVAVHTRAYPEPVTEDIRRQFAAELGNRAGAAGAPVRLLAGTPQARRDGDSVVFELVDVAGTALVSTVVTRDDQDALDVRDRSFLGKRRRDRSRGEFVWRLILAGGAAAALAALFDAGALGFGLLSRSLHGRIALQAPVVEKLETANSLTSRVDELTNRRLRFFEMLSVINEPRPHSIQFTRTGTNGHLALEIEAQTNSADDIGTYETALHQLAALEKVEVRDLRARDGVTTFALAVVFRAEGSPTAPAGGGPP